MIRDKIELSNERWTYMSTGMGLKIERHVIDYTLMCSVKKKYCKNNENILQILILHLLLADLTAK